MFHLAKGLYLYATSKEEYSILLLGLDNAGKTTFLNQIKSLYQQPPSQGTSNNGIFSVSSKSPGDTVPTVGQNVSTISLPSLYLKIWDVGGQHSLRSLWQSYYASCHAIVFVIDSTDVGDGDISRLAGAGAGGSSADRYSSSSRPLVSRKGTGTGSSPRHSRHSSLQQQQLENEQRTEGKPNEEGEVMQNEEEQQEEEEEETVTRGRLDECRLVLETILNNTDTEGVPLLILANKQDREDCIEVVRIKEGLVRKVFENEKLGHGAGAPIRDSRVLPISALTGRGVKEAVEWLSSRVRWNREGRPPVLR
ncbi:MAG: ADP-ribosylation factor protein 3 [Watsoniomyces obsoletus]|nr:MAG: ADP-ribosylation factor protein 3 [Watsoniomyces obsoletus]